MCVVLVYFLTLHMSIGENFMLDHKTSRDKGGACENGKWKRCNWISPDITLGRNYPSAGYFKGQVDEDISAPWQEAFSAIRDVQTVLYFLAKLWDIVALVNF